MARLQEIWHGLGVFEERRHTFKKDNTLLGLQRTGHNSGEAIKVQCTMWEKKGCTFVPFSSLLPDK